MKCKAVLKEIEELEQGAQLPLEAQAHLPGCESCRAFREERAALRQLIGSLDKISAPPDFDWRLRARLAEARSREAERERRWLPGFAPGVQAITVAASVTLLLVGVIVYRQATRPLANAPKSATVATTLKVEASEEVKAVPAVNQQGAAPMKDSAGAEGSGVNEAARTTRGVRGVRVNSVKTENSVAAAAPQQQQRIYSTDYGSLGAQEFTSTGLQNPTANAAGPVIFVRLPAPKPTQLRFEDGQGTRRTLSSVNFGGQESVGRQDKARLVPTSEKGIW